MPETGGLSVLGVAPTYQAPSLQAHECSVGVCCQESGADGIADYLVGGGNEPTLNWNF